MRTPRTPSYRRLAWMERQLDRAEEHGYKITFGLLAVCTAGMLGAVLGHSHHLTSERSTAEITVVSAVLGGTAVGAAVVKVAAPSLQGRVQTRPNDYYYDESYQIDFDPATDQYIQTEELIKGLSRDEYFVALDERMSTLESLY